MLLSDVLFSCTTSAILLCLLKQVLDPTIQKLFHIVQGQMYHIPKNLASNVNLSYFMNLWTLETKLHKNSCWTFFQ